MFICQPGVDVREHARVVHPSHQKDVEKSSQKRRLPMSPQTANRDSTGVLCTLIANTQSLFLDF